MRPLEIEMSPIRTSLHPSLVENLEMNRLDRFSRQFLGILVRIPG